MKTWFGRQLAKLSGSTPARGVRREVRARYDSAQTTDDNRRHWAASDALSANAANDRGTREKLIARSRYACANNSYLNGLNKTLGHDLIGSGPRLQLSVEGNEDAARAVEKQFVAWMRLGGIVDKLRVAAETEVRDGEAFALMITNPRGRHPVKLDLRLIEAEQVATPYYASIDADQVDGINYDEFGNPVSYSILKQHPGGGITMFTEATLVDASKVLHWYRPDRPGQGRGVTKFQPVLETAEILRRYTKAELLKNEFGANVSGVLYTDQPPGEAITEGASWERIEIERNALLTAPASYKAEQFEAAATSGTFAEFKRETLNEIGRCVCAPLNVVSGNSSGYNYSSGRLDHQVYHRALWIDRERLRAAWLDRIFIAWLEEAALIPGMIADGLPPLWRVGMGLALGRLYKH
jgi:capsid protein